MAKSPKVSMLNEEETTYMVDSGQKDPHMGYFAKTPVLGTWVVCTVQKFLGRDRSSLHPLLLYSRYLDGNNKFFGIGTGVIGSFL